jgi:hypothetical protein
MVPALPSAREGEAVCRRPMGDNRDRGSAGVGGGAEALHARIAGRFARAEPRRRVLAYLRGLLGAVTPRTAGSWPSMPGRGPPMGCSGCWPPPTGTPTWSVTTCAARWWSSWVTRRRCWSWTRPGSSRRGPPRWGAAPGLGHGRQGRQLPARGVLGLRQPGGGRSSTGSCTCPAAGPTTRRGAALPGSRPRCRFGPSPSCPGHAGARLGRRGPGRLGDRR